jgi:hypothetical protein
MHGTEDRTRLALFREDAQERLPIGLGVLKRAVYQVEPASEELLKFRADAFSAFLFVLEKPHQTGLVLAENGAIFGINPAVLAVKTVKILLFGRAG